MLRGSLFTRYFLEEGITETDVWKAIDPGALDALRSAIDSVFSAFPTGLTPNESQTEDDLIWKVLELLGWTEHLRQQNLSAKGKDDVPDGLLFADAEAKAHANTKHDEWRRYSDGITIVESKRWLRQLDRKDALAEDIGVPSTQMLRYLRRVDDVTEGKLRWGILTNGRFWRLYWKGATSVSEDFLELDLAKLAGVDGFEPDLLDGDLDHWFRVFVLMFRREAFLAGTDGRTFHQISLGDGALWESRVTDKLSELVFKKAFPDLVKGIVAADPQRPDDLNQAYLDAVRDDTLGFVDKR